MTEAEIRFEIQTPMFLGGASAGGAEFRLPALRGAMRFWFRAFAGHLYGNELGKVARAEARLFGSASGSQGRRSSVVLRPVELPRRQEPPTPQWLGNCRWVGYLLGQGLFDPPDRLKRRALAAGGQGRFVLSAPTPEAAQLATMCLWALSTFGGLGSRVHRGFGGISFAELAALWPEVPDQYPGDLTGVHRSFAAAACPLLGEQPAVADPGAYPRWPSFARWNAQLSPRNFAQWEAALDAAGGNLRNFRATVDRTQAPYNRADLEDDPFHRWVMPEYAEIVCPQPPPRTRPGRAAFPLASFGLPLVFAHDATVSLRAGNKELRRASPLWIRPYRRSNGSWTLLYHVFQAELWPAAANMVLSVRQQPQPVELILAARDAYEKLQSWMDQAP